MSARSASLLRRQLGAAARAVFQVPAIAIVLFISVVLTGIAWRFISEQARDKAEETFTHQADEIAAALSQRMIKYALLLEGANGLLAASQNVTQKEWATYVRSLDIATHYPGVQAVGFGPVVAGPDKAAFERLTGQRLREFRIFPEGRRDQHVPVLFIEPFAARNLRALGFDMYSEPIRRQAMDLARDTGLLTMTTGLRLVQETDAVGQTGFLLFKPVYKLQTNHERLSERRSGLRGFAYIAFRMQDFMDAAVLPATQGLDFEILDGDGPQASRRIYATPGMRLHDKGEYRPELTHTEIVNLGGSGWTLRFFSKPGYVQDVGGAGPRYVVFGGIAVNLLLFALLGSVAGQRTRAVEMARRMTDDLRASHLRFQAVTESAHDAIVTLDEDDRVLYANPAAEQLLGRRQDEIAGRTFGSLVALPEGVDLPGGDIVVTEPFRHEVEIRVPADEARTAEMSLAMWRAGGRVFRTGILRDVTARRRAEREIIAAREAAEAASRAKSDFLATMSHEIRTPMNGVLGMAELLSLSDLDGAQRQQVDVIQRSANALLALINDILDFSRMEAGFLRLEATRFDLEDLVHDVGRLVMAGSSKLHVELVVDVDERCRGVFLGDVSRVRQLLTNLVGNAMKFTEQGHVRVFVEPGSDAAHPGVQVTISDTGIGISKEAAGRLFSPFTQADSSTTRRYGGTGLGLAICKRLVEAMGGTLGMQSEPAKGSKFWFSLPLQRVRSAEPLPALRIDTVFVLMRPGPLRDSLCHALQCLRLNVGAGADLSHGLVSRGHCWILVSKRLVGDATLVDRLRNSGLPHVIVEMPGEHCFPCELEDIGACGELQWPAPLGGLAHALEDITRRVYDGTSAAANKAGARASRNGTVLVVDDNEVNLDVARAMLHYIGVNVLVAKNGREALKLWERKTVDLILMDDAMPTLDGPSATRQLRELPGGQDVPVIGLTGTALPEEQQRCLDAGMNEVLTKPVHQAELEQVLARWMKQGDGRPSAPAAVFDALPILDRAALAEVERDTGMSAEKWLERYLGDSRKVLDELSRALAVADFHTALRLAHGMKSSSALIGASRMADLMRRLEVAAKEEDAQALRKLSDLALVALADLDQLSYQPARAGA